MPDPSEYRSLSPELLAEFSAGAGHDLNNPLAAVSGRVQLLLREETDPAKRADLAVILTQVKRAQDMIADLRLTARPPLPEKKRFRLTDFWEKLRESFAERFRQQGVAFLVRELKPEDPSETGAETQTGKEAAGTEAAKTGKDSSELFADETQMMVLFRALVKNSLRALGGPGEIAISYRRRPENTVTEIFVTDSGTGIPAEIRPFIFDPYFSSYQSGRGLGFGLTKARILAKMHGGDVVFDETADQTTFRVTISDT